MDELETLKAENAALKAKLDFSERRRESVVEGLLAANDSLRACDDKLIAQATAERDAAQAHAAEGWAIAKAVEADALRYFNQCEALSSALEALGWAAQEPGAPAGTYGDNACYDGCARAGLQKHSPVCEQARAALAKVRT